MRLTLLCLRFFLLGPPSMRCHHSPSSFFIAERIERAGPRSWKECSFSTKARHQLLVKVSFLFPPKFLFLPSRAFSVFVFCSCELHFSFLLPSACSSASSAFCFFPFYLPSRLLRSAFRPCSHELVPCPSLPFAYLPPPRSLLPLPLDRS